MKISVQIERLILDGLPLEKRQGLLVQATVESELVRLVAAFGLGHKLRSGGSVPHIGGSGFRLSNVDHPNRLGQQIAWSIYSSIRGTR
jgi:hypothetical protein